MTRFLTIVLVCVVLFGDSPQSQSQSSGYIRKATQIGGEDVSLIQLIGNPYSYDNKRVRTRA